MKESFIWTILFGILISGALGYCDGVDGKKKKSCWISIGIFVCGILIGALSIL